MYFLKYVTNFGQAMSHTDPNLRTISILVSCLARGGRPQKMRGLSDRVRRAVVDLQTWWAIY